MTATALAAVGSNANENGTLIISGTAVTLTNQTAPDLSTTIPSWVKRITVMFNGVSLSNVTPYGIIQVGSGSYATSGYVCTVLTAVQAATNNVISRTDGFVWGNLNAVTDTVSGHMILTLINGNNWVASATFGNSGTVRVITFGGNISLGGALDRIRVTTTDGTTQLDAGTINIFWE